MPSNPFRNKAKTTEHIQFWVDETLKEAAEKFGDTPVGAYVLIFTKTKKGNVGSIYKRMFQSPENSEGIRTKELVSALDDEAFNIRFQAATDFRNKTRKK